MLGKADNMVDFMSEMRTKKKNKIIKSLKTVKKKN